MDMWAFRKVMRDAFSIVSEPSEENPKLIRLMGPPYNPFDPNCRATSVTGHAGGTRLCPQHILAVLKKFDITPTQFLDALEGQEPAPPSSPSSTKPNTIN
jgi:hypothetical protein